MISSTCAMKNINGPNTWHPNKGWRVFIIIFFFFLRILVGQETWLKRHECSKLPLLSKWHKMIWSSYVSWGIRLGGKYRVAKCEPLRLEKELFKFFSVRRCCWRFLGLHVVLVSDTLMNCRFSLSPRLKLANLKNGRRLNYAWWYCILISPHDIRLTPLNVSYPSPPMLTIWDWLLTLVVE
jgi:hypothetical protein